MTEKIKKLEISQSELKLIADALETQTKILHMQASAGGNGALAQLIEVKRVLAMLYNQSDVAVKNRSETLSVWGLLRSMGQVT